MKESTGYVVAAITCLFVGGLLLFIGFKEDILLAMCFGVSFLIGAVFLGAAIEGALEYEEIVLRSQIKTNLLIDSLSDCDKPKTIDFVNTKKLELLALYRGELDAVKAKGDKFQKQIYKKAIEKLEADKSPSAIENWVEQCLNNI